ncbi:hypothetical protein F5050DRAFT_1216332 [Lentinula boryana]|uniref:Uncharacterized protein n=1 Tax=Lentinula boryana TaxID=40481 RepID=A0ABQ8PYM9_9AGAR|nr:hypothetical protein F5050DRAFT_1216332 [Lentinula boryana]
MISRVSFPVTLCCELLTPAPSLQAPGLERNSTIDIFPAINHQCIKRPSGFKGTRMVSVSWNATADVKPEASPSCVSGYRNRDSHCNIIVEAGMSPLLGSLQLYSSFGRDMELLKMELLSLAQEHSCYLIQTPSLTSALRASSIVSAMLRGKAFLRAVDTLDCVWAHLDGSFHGLNSAPLRMHRVCTARNVSSV